MENKANTLNYIFKKLLSSVFIFILFLNAYFYFQQPKMLFYPVKDVVITPEQWGLSYDKVSFALEDTTKISGWYLPHPEANKTVLFFHGNGGNISHRGDSLYIFHKLKLNVLIIDYPGYGNSEGMPSEKGIYLSANAAWQYLIAEKKTLPENIIIFGRSLGGAVAVDLASRVSAGAVILESTFTSVRDVVDIVFPVLSHFIYLRYSFDSLSKIHKVQSPLLMIHSPDDEVIPYILGQKLFSAITTKKHFQVISGGHNDGFMKSISSYISALRAFTHSI